MVWKDNKFRKRLDIEKVVKSGFSGKFSQERNFINKEEVFRDAGEIDFEDHELDEKEKRDIKEMEELERRGLM